MLIYFGFSALIAFAATTALLLFAEPSLLAAIHLVFALAALPLIFAAIAHFIPVLTRSGDTPRMIRLAPLLLQLSGATVVLHFYAVLGLPALAAAAAVGTLVSVCFALWMASRARHALGTPHPGWRWYLAALTFLALGLALVPVMTCWPETRPALRLLHLHLNILGFIGLAAIGTLQVLLPTVLGGPDAAATTRLRRDLPLAVVGVSTTALGAAFWWPLSLFGAALLLVVAGRLGWSWWRRYGLRAITGDGASAALAAALFGFVLMLILGAVHGVDLLNGHDAVLAFVAAFLLPLVTGALSQLLPVWRFPGRRTPEREQLRTVLAQGGAARALLFLAAGFLLAFGRSEGLALMAVGVLHFALQSVRAFCFPR